MRRAAAIVWLIRRPGIVAGCVLLPLALLACRLAVTVVRHVRGRAVVRSGFVPVLPPHVPGEVLVRLTGTDAAAVSRAARAAGARQVEQVPGTQVHRLRLPAGTSVVEALDRLVRSPGVAWAEPNYLVQTCRVPRGPRFAELWGLRNIGRTFHSPHCGEIAGVPGADITAAPAWDRTRGSRQVVVAIVDSGVDLSHPNLRPNLWTNPGEVPRNGMDDDHNGYVDDVHGYDFANRRGDPVDDHGHGTHVAGTIGAAGSDGTGVVGVNWEVRLMPLKFMDASGQGDIAAATEALAYAARHGAPVINASWGGEAYSQALLEAMRESPALIVTAAGNGGVELDQDPFFPASYDLPNALVVAASDPRDALGCFSSWSQTGVDVAAPGVAILSTLPTYECALTREGLSTGYDYLDGTSMAVPHGTGALALLTAALPHETPGQRRHRLIATARAGDGLERRCAANGCISLATALVPDKVPPLAEAGGDTAAPPNATVTLDASASLPYPSRSLTRYTWSEAGKVLRRSREPRLTYRASVRGKHRVRLEVADDHGAVGRDVVEITVADRVLSADAITLEKRDDATLGVRLVVRDAATGRGVSRATVAVLLTVPGPRLFRGAGRTDRHGEYRGEWCGNGPLPTGRYEAKLLVASHTRYVWDRHRTTGLLTLGSP